MYKNAHFWFGAGICSILLFLFGFSLPSIILIGIITGIISVSPDWDQKISFVGHRGPTHSFGYILLITIPASVLLLYVAYFINTSIQMHIFTVSMSDAGFPFPQGFTKIASGDIIAFFIDPLLFSFIAVFAGASTHILLDIITPSGLELFDRKIYGGILSEDPKTNKVFVLSGLFLFLASLSLSIATGYIHASFYGSIFLMCIVIIVGIVFFISLRRRHSRIMDKYVCYNIGGKRFCTAKKGCVQIAGEEICPPTDKIRRKKN